MTTENTDNINDTSLPENVRHASTGSQPANHPERLTPERISFVRGMPLAELMDAAQSNKSKWNQIHEDIYTSYMLNPENVTELQIETMETFVVSHTDIGMPKIESQEIVQEAA